VKGLEAAVVQVFLVRHGQSESNAGLPSADPASIPLTATGRRQAQQVAQAFAGVPALIVTSPYLRARQTARPLIARYPAAACRQWPVQEFTYLGDLHGRASTAREREPYTRAYWDRSDPHAAIGGAESFAGLLGRVTDFLARLSPLESGPVVVFTHGMFMRAVAWSVLTGITVPDQDQMRSFRRFTERFLVPNASVIELRHADDGTAQLTGCTIHLPSRRN
jgi:broad specificity phosphatase PhoE